LKPISTTPKPQISHHTKKLKNPMVVTGFIKHRRLTMAIYGGRERERERESNQIGSIFWGSDAKHQDLLLMFLTSLTLLRLDKTSRIHPWQQIKKPFI
jgi:hypothetical protein